MRQTLKQMNEKVARYRELADEYSNFYGGGDGDIKGFHKKLERAREMPGKTKAELEVQLKAWEKLADVYIRTFKDDGCSVRQGHIAQLLFLQGKPYSRRFSSLYIRFRLDDVTFSTTDGTIPWSTIPQNRFVATITDTSTGQVIAKDIQSHYVHG